MIEISYGLLYSIKSFNLFFFLLLIYSFFYLSKKYFFIFFYLTIVFSFFSFYLFKEKINTTHKIMIKKEIKNNVEYETYIDNRKNNIYKEEPLVEN
jgi:hypothetical protein